MNAVDETPVDLGAVQADDALLDGFLRRADAALVAGLRARLDTGGDLARVLAAWRRDVDAEPVGELVDPGVAVDAVRAARRRRVLGPDVDDDAMALEYELRAVELGRLLASLLGEDVTGDGS